MRKTTTFWQTKPSFGGEPVTCRSIRHTEGVIQDHLKRMLRRQRHLGAHEFPFCIDQQEAGNGRSIVIFSEVRSEEHKTELQSLMRISYAVFCLKKTTTIHRNSKTQTMS